MRDTKQYTVFSANSQTSANFTAATTDIITSASHGLSENDPVVLTTTGTLPAGLSTATVYYVRAVTTNTFKLSTSAGDGNLVDITDTGSGTHTWTQSKLGRVIFAEDFRNVVLSLTATGGTVSFTVKFFASDQEAAPNPLAAASSTNVFEYIQAINLNSGATIDGDTGLAFAAAAVERVELQSNGAKWVGAIISTHSNGQLDATVKLSDNG